MKFFPGATAQRVALAAAASAALLMSGCANASPGVVAYVGEDQITQQQVESAVTAVSTTVQEGQTVSQEAIVNAMIQGKLAEQIAADQRIAITDAQRNSFLQTTNLAPLVEVAGAKPVAYDVADQQLVAQKMGAGPFLAEVEKRDVTLNPRYGVLDPKQKIVVTDQSGSLSRPAAGQTP